MTSKDRDGNAMFDIVSKWGKREKIYVEKTPENQDATLEGGHRIMNMTPTAIPTVVTGRTASIELVLTRDQRASIRL